MVCMRELETIVLLIITSPRITTLGIMDVSLTRLVRIIIYMTLMVKIEQPINLITQTVEDSLFLVHLMDLSSYQLHPIHIMMDIHPFHLNHRIYMQYISKVS